MDLYFSWAHSDPHYHSVVPGCGVLISVPNVSAVWTVQRLPRRPDRLMIDSGGYQAMQGIQLGVRATFRRQLRMAAGVPNVTLCLLDVPLPKTGLNARERFARLEQTIANAHAYKALAAEQPPGTVGDLLAVIQGDDSVTIRYCAQEIARLGYSHFGLGSLAPLYSTREIVRRVEAAIDVVGPGLHVFGVSAIATMRELGRLGVASLDTARPMHAAIYHVIFYSRPFRRYGIYGTTYSPGHTKFSTDRELRAPLPCDCPPCLEHPGRLLQPRGQAGIHHRALHNSYHLAREVESLWAEAGRYA